MNTSNEIEHLRCRRNGAFMGAIAVLFLIIGIAMLTFNQTVWSIISLITAVVFWNQCIDHFEKSVEFEPPKSRLFSELLQYSSKLKDGLEVAIAIQLRFFDPNEYPSLQTIETRIARALNEDLPLRETLGVDSCRLIDQLLRTQLYPLAEQLGLHEFSIYTVEAKTIGSPPKSRGLVLGER